MRIKSVCIFVFCLLLKFPIYAEETAIKLSSEAIQEAETDKQQTWMNNFNKARKNFTDKYGTVFAFIANYQHQWALRSKYDETKDKGAGYYNLEVDQRLWKGATVVIEGEGGKGKGIDGILPSISIFDGSAGEPNYFYIPILYLKQTFNDEKLYFMAGKLDVSDWCDTNVAANSGDTEFLSSSLVYNLSIPFPAKGIGAFGGIKFTDWNYFQMGISNVKSKATTTGINDLFNNNFEPFIIGEFGITPKIHELQGNYRFIIWDSENKIEQFNQENDKDNDYGAAISFDQEITKKITLFLRYGYADKNVRKISQFLSGGFMITDLIPWRKNDYLGFGISQSFISNAYQSTHEADTASAETMYETYYSIKLNEILLLIPNLQVVTNPDADKTAKNDVVAGIRVVLVI